MEAKGKYILIEKQDATSRKVAGLELTEKQDKENRFALGTVISVGEIVKEHGDYVKEGDVVFYNKTAGHKINPDGRVLYVIQYGDIVGVQ